MASQIEKGIKSVRKEIDHVLDKLEKFIIEISKMVEPKSTRKAASKKDPAKKASTKKTAADKKSTSAKKKPAPKKKIEKQETTQKNSAN